MGSTVVVVGGGYGGATDAKALDRLRATHKAVRPDQGRVAENHVTEKHVTGRARDRGAVRPQPCSFNTMKTGGTSLSRTTRASSSARVSRSVSSSPEGSCSIRRQVSA